MNTSPYLAAMIVAERQRALVEAANEHRIVRDAMVTDVPHRRRRWRRLWALRRRPVAVVNTAEPEPSGLPLYPTTA